MAFALKKRSVLPGFGLSLGYTIVWLSLIVLIPLGVTLLKASTLTWEQFRQIVTSPRALASYRLTFGASLSAATVNLFFGVLTAWVLVRHPFPGRRLLDSLVDLPFALPTAVAGIALTTIYAPNGRLGRPLATIGVKPAYSPLGVTVALIFIGLPFVVRTVQPVLEDMDREMEEAAASLGADRLQIFSRIVMPTILPAALTGFAMALARAIGEYGSVVFIAGNIPMRTEITSLLIMTRLDEFDYVGATAIAMVMLLCSFCLLLPINLLQRWSGRHEEKQSAAPARLTPDAVQEAGR